MERRGTSSNKPICSQMDADFIWACYDSLVAIFVTALHLSQKVGWGLKGGVERERSVPRDVRGGVLSAFQLDSGSQNAAGLVTMADAGIFIIVYVCYYHTNHNKG